jgi:hypothetical protein
MGLHGALAGADEAEVVGRDVPQLDREVSSMSSTTAGRSTLSARLVT